MVKSYAIGKRIGFLLSALVFFTIMFLILSYLDKLPSGLRYIHFVIFAVVVWIVKFGAIK